MYLNSIFHPIRLVPSLISFDVSSRRSLLDPSNYDDTTRYLEQSPSPGVSGDYGTMEERGKRLWRRYDDENGHGKQPRTTLPH